MSLNNPLWCSTPSAHYPLYQAPLSVLPEILPPASHYAVVVDSTVWALHQPRITLALSTLPHYVHVVPAGEHSKNFQTLEKLLTDMLKNGLTRKGCSLAIGGGMVGDLAGFAASMALRGVPFVQVPTTLLAQVDSSVGGKTAINCGAGKNMVGAFYQPAAVLMDSAFLQTLPTPERRAGYAEILKYALLGDADFYNWLEINGKAVLELEETAVRHAIKTSCQHKIRIVGEDEKEQGIRALLNLGHTFGHGIEAESNYQVLHGEAVALGCLMAIKASVLTGICAQDVLERVQKHQESLGFSTTLSTLLGRTPNVQDIMAHMLMDKKGAGNFILIKNLGTAVQQALPDSMVLQVLEEFI
jgi:3-dehydroquinate synthase